MHKRTKSVFHWIGLGILLVGLLCFFYFKLYRYLSFAALKEYHQELQAWKSQHLILSIVLYCLIYIVAVALSVPGAVFITLVGGFLFGPIGTVFVVVSATIGATIIFLAVKTTLGAWLAAKAKGWVAKMKMGFQKNALNYLVVLRLIPIFPFWAINIVAALLKVKTRIFVIATFFGIIPGSFVYVMLGSGLHTFFQGDHPPNLNIIFSPAILLPLLGLAILAILPVIFRKWKEKKDANHKS